MDTIQTSPRACTASTPKPRAKLWGVVAAKPELDNGAKVTTGDWSVSSVLSHEVLEMFVNPNCNLWANDGKGSAYSFEVCDPVEAPSYPVNGVSVSNFVTPSWFDPLAPATAQFDKLGQLHGPFSILKGGYLVYESAGKEQQKFGDEFPAVAPGHEAPGRWPAPGAAWRRPTLADDALPAQALRIQAIDGATGLRGSSLRGGGSAPHSSALDARLSVRGITSVTCSIVSSAISSHFLYGSCLA